MRVRLIQDVTLLRTPMHKGSEISTTDQIAQVLIKMGRAVACDGPPLETATVSNKGRKRASNKKNRNAAS